MRMRGASVQPRSTADYVLVITPEAPLRMQEFCTVYFSIRSVNIKISTWGLEIRPYMKHSHRVKGPAWVGRDVDMTVFQTLVQYGHLTRLIAREDYLKFSSCESSKTYMTVFRLYQSFPHYAQGTCLLIHLTPWCRICEKLFVIQLVKKILFSLRNPKVHYRVHKSPPQDPILSQPNPFLPSIPVSLLSISHLSLCLRTTQPESSLKALVLLVRVYLRSVKTSTSRHLSTVEVNYSWLSNNKYYMLPCKCTDRFLQNTSIERVTNFTSNVRNATIQYTKFVEMLSIHT
jgi:hypothetical protein